MEPRDAPEHVRENAWVDCGWGRLLFGQTFSDDETLTGLLEAEQPGRRDICVYHPAPQVLVSKAPHRLFIDPSFMFRRRLGEGAPPLERPTAPQIDVRPLVGREDCNAVNRIYTTSGMVTAPSEEMEANQRTREFVYLVAVDELSGEIVGTVTGVDHVKVFGDPEGGSSLWCLAVDPACSRPGVGALLVHALLEDFERRGRRMLDLSVMHDNLPAIRLYEKLDFEQVPLWCVKRKNPLNEPLFTAPATDEFDALNPYARIVADEARRRGIHVEVVDTEGGFLRLSHGGREVITRESLSELTSAVALSWCDDKRVTRRLLARAGLHVPRGQSSTDTEADAEFLAAVGEVVVKPARGEQGRGVVVGITEPGQLHTAVEQARGLCPDVLLEERCEGEDLRIVVIDEHVVAAAVRRPAAVVADGRHTVEELIAAQSRRRAAATEGESRIPLDEATEETVRQAGFELGSVPPEGQRITVRRTANLHTGGTIHDVTERLHPTLAAGAVTAARVLELPVAGVDLIVPTVTGPDYVVIEVNERPGLANHEPQPTAERFIDLLFPSTAALPRGWDPAAAGHAFSHRP